jgi:hypothetical protein
VIPDFSFAAVFEVASYLVLSIVVAVIKLPPAALVAAFEGEPFAVPRRFAAELLVALQAAFELWHVAKPVAAVAPTTWLVVVSDVLLVEFVDLVHEEKIFELLDFADVMTRPKYYFPTLNPPSIVHSYGQHQCPLKKNCQYHV